MRSGRSTAVVAQGTVNICTKVEQWRWKRGQWWEERGVSPASGPGAITSSREDQKRKDLEVDRRIWLWMNRTEL